MKKRFLKRPLSYSQLSSWDFSPDQWYRQYILGERDTPNPAMLFGSTIGDAIGTPDSPVPDLTPPGVKEYKLTGEINGIKLLGFADHYCPETLILHENKTSDNPKRWTKRKADTHKQIDMYLLLLNLTEGIPPERVTCYLNFIETRPSGLGYRLHNPPRWQQFPIKTKTMSDLDKFTEYLHRTVEAMQEYIEEKERAPVYKSPRPPAFKGV